MVLSAAEVEVIVPLYCCLLGKAGGFASKLRDSLCANNATVCRVCGNSTSGRTALSPYKLFYEGMSSLGGPGGTQIVPKDNKVLWAKWQEALKTDLRFAFPALTLQEIHSRL